MHIYLNINFCILTISAVSKSYDIIWRPTCIWFGMFFDSRYNFFHMKRWPITFFINNPGGWDSFNCILINKSYNRPWFLHFYIYQKIKAVFYSNKKNFIYNLYICKDESPQWFSIKIWQNTGNRLTSIDTFLFTPYSYHTHAYILSHGHLQHTYAQIHIHT